MVCSKHFTYSTETEIDLGWKWELQQVDIWVRERGIQLYHNRAEGMWFDKEGNFGFKVVRPDSNAFRVGVNWNKGKSSGARGNGFDLGRKYSTAVEVADALA
jgi:hypothetical protein